MFHSLLVLGVLAKRGSGVGLTRIISDCEELGFLYSKYKMRQILNDLKSVGAVSRVKNHYVMTLFGANLVIADVATSHGYHIAYELNLGQDVSYQKELAI